MLLRVRNSARHVGHQLAKKYKTTGWLACLKSVRERVTPSMVVTSKSGADWPTRLPVWGGGGAGAFVGGTGVGVSVGGTAVGGAGVGVSAGGAAGVVAGWAGVLAAAVGVASSVPLRLPMFCKERVFGVAVGGVVAAVGGVTVGCACSTGAVVCSGVAVDSSARVHPAAAIAIAAAMMNTASRSDTTMWNGCKFIVFVREDANLRRHGLQGHAPRVGGRRAGCAAQRDDSVAIDDDLRRLLGNAKVCLHLCVEHRHLPWVSLFSGIVIYRRDGLGRVYIDGDEGDIILEVGVHILDGPQLGPA